VRSRQPVASTTDDDHLVSLARRGAAPHGGPVSLLTEPGPQEPQRREARSEGNLPSQWGDLPLPVATLLAVHGVSQFDTDRAGLVRRRPVDRRYEGEDLFGISEVGPFV